MTQGDPRRTSRNRWFHALLLTLVACAILTVAPAQAAHSTFSPPLTGGTDFATGFPSFCGVGPVGLVFDSTNFYAVDFCTATTYKFPLAGGSASAQPQNANGLSAGVAVQAGQYYGVACCGRSALADGLYEFNPLTLNVIRPVTTAIGSPRAVVADPSSGDLYVSTCSGPSQIFRIQNPGGVATVTPFGNQSGSSNCFDGLYFTSDGATLFATDYNSQTIRGYAKSSGSQTFTVSVCCHGPDGIAVARAGTNINGVDVSNNVFVNDNDGTILRIDTNNANAVSVVASGGTRGDFATVGPDGCFYVTQADLVEKISPCIFQTTVVHPTSTSVSCVPDPVTAGQSTTCTATVTDAALSGGTTPQGTVGFTSSGPGAFGASSCTLVGTGSSASCSVSYTPGISPAPVRVDTITAAYGGSSAHAASSGTTAVTVNSIGPPDKLTLTQTTDINKAGQEHCVTATVTDANGTPVPGAAVDFTVTGANPQTPATTTLTTDATGQARFCYTGTHAGLDTITAAAQGGSKPSASVTKRYTAADPATVVLTPKIATNVVGNPHTVTATVTDAFGNPAANISVIFSVAGANSASGSAVTNASGQATFTYTGTHFGSDVIGAFADTNGNGVQDPGEPLDTAAKLWTLAALDHFKCYKVGGNGDQQSGAQGHQDGDHADSANPVVVTLRDQFGTSKVVVDSRRLLCNPADKNGEGIVTPTAHLVGFGVHPAGDKSKSGEASDDNATQRTRFVEVANQFGTQILQVENPVLLLVPAAKALRGFVPGPVPITVNPFYCYGVHGEGPAPRLTVSLTDQFGHESVVVGRARMLCNPVDENGQGIGPVPAGGHDHLVCYAISARNNGQGGGEGQDGSPRRTVTVRDQFGLQTIDVGDRHSLCVPSNKREVPPPGGDHRGGSGESKDTASKP